MILAIRHAGAFLVELDLPLEEAIASRQATRALDLGAGVELVEVSTGRVVAITEVSRVAGGESLVGWRLLVEVPVVVRVSESDVGAVR